jgi:hypothetical protein
MAKQHGRLGPVMRYIACVCVLGSAMRYAQHRRAPRHSMCDALRTVLKTLFYRHLMRVRDVTVPTAFNGIGTSF